METRTELVTARLTPVERRRVEVAAACRDVSRSEFVREAADRQAREALARFSAERLDGGES